MAQLEAQSSASRTEVPGPRASGIAQGQLGSLLREPLPGKTARQNPATTYSPDSLYQYIDGGADIYLLYDFQALLHQDFKIGATDLITDIYEMGKREDAFGIYASERSPGYKFVAIGGEGYRDRGILNFFADRYYVKLSGSGANVGPLLDQFARLVSGRIGGVRTLPPLLEKLPREHRVLHSEQYVKKDPLGHAFLAPAYVVTYAEGKQEIEARSFSGQRHARRKVTSGATGKAFQAEWRSDVSARVGREWNAREEQFRGKCDRTNPRALSDCAV